MKRLLYAVMLLLGMSVMVSCEKEGGVGDKSNLEGKWWVPFKTEALFNGKVVGSVSYRDTEYYYGDYDYKALFQDGNCTLVDINTDYRSVEPYSYLNGILTIIYKRIPILNLTSKEATIGISVCDYSSVVVRETIGKPSNGRVLTTFEGINIYSENGENDEPFWYYNKKGEVVQCFYNRCTSAEKVWDEEAWEYVWKYTFDYFIDDMRFYFRAE